MSDDTSYKLDELARAAGTSARTVRYYVQRGLLPAPAFRGKDSSYGREHLVRLQAIRKMQDAFFPLDAIAVELAQRSFAEIERIADGTDLPMQAVLTPEPSSGSGSGFASAPPSSPVSISVTAAVRQKQKQARVFHRIEIAPGIELSIADDAPASSRSVAERILRELEK